MQHFFVIKLKHVKKWGLVLTAALFTAFFLWVEGESSFSVFSSKDHPAALSRGSEDDPNIALTFNISWGNEMVEPILQKLKDHNVQATFFLSGEWVERHPGIVKKIEEDEHEIGMMGYRYKSYIKQEKEQIRKDLIKAKDIFGKLGYPDTNLLRTPSGHLNKEIIQLAEHQGYKVIQWNVNPRDWENPGTQNIIDHVMENTSNGDIILLHASDSVKQTPKALDTILPGLKNKGFEFVDITELISRAESKEKEVE
ncbi:polysaccharide deacetylase family sporulation protein PdaB [Aquibacillus albus]|uniref:Polysaccharide deacetylase family sporulation protein PdaB n=1 Tax=Aquibacillus albus TaxID=1168171 RepID=A0ABS2N4I5_9BACI|nr:polysaccharide deacetylase family sporulation protein PdaB [Aquibacillus albus]MBM7573052.1 polysaccharide deacetylase family sporulation protein PdaB [Aquibacillus albus]